MGKAPEEDPPPDYKPAAGYSGKANNSSANSTQLEGNFSNHGPESPRANKPNAGPDDEGFNPCGYFQRCCWGDCTLQRGCYAVGAYHLIISAALLVAVGEIYILNETARVGIS